MGKRLFVGNLAFSMTEMDVRDMFAGHGDIVEAKLVLDRDTGRSRGFAFVELATDDAAQKAIAELNGRDVHGRPVTVREAEERPQRGGGGGGRDRGGRGGGGRDRDRGGRW